MIEREYWFISFTDYSIQNITPYCENYDGMYDSISLWWCLSVLTHSCIHSKSITKTDSYTTGSHRREDNLIRSLEHLAA